MADEAVQSQKSELLIIDDDEAWSGSLQRQLSNQFTVHAANSVATAWEMVSPPPDIVLLDVRLRKTHDDRSGILLLSELHSVYPELPIIMATAFNDVRIAEQCLRSGAADFIDKEATDAEGIKTRLLLARSRTPAEAGLHEIVGENPQIRELKQLIQVVAASGPISVLIRGETGSGKDLVAKAIHASSERRSHPFVPVDLVATPKELIESSLFGHEKGAFTGADIKRIGFLERAHRGTVFLDEIGEIDAQAQAKLLTVLDHRTFYRIGNNKFIQVDVQVLAATNSDLRKSIQEGKFRQDLYYRLHGHEIIVPPLRVRRDDIPLLVKHFLHRHQRPEERPVTVSKAAMSALCEYNWPGNVRQLSAVISSAMIYARFRKHSQIEVEDLRLETADQSILGRHEIKKGFNIHEALARIELSYIEEALRITGGSKIKASELLGYADRRTLYRRKDSLIEAHPHLKSEFPGLDKK